MREEKTNSLQHEMVTRTWFSEEELKTYLKRIVRELETSVDLVNKGSNHPRRWNKRNMAR